MRANVMSTRTYSRNGILFTMLVITENTQGNYSNGMHSAFVDASHLGRCAASTSWFSRTYYQTIVLQKYTYLPSILNVFSVHYCGYFITEVSNSSVAAERQYKDSYSYSVQGNYLVQAMTASPTIVVENYHQCYQVKLQTAPTHQYKLGFLYNLVGLSEEFIHKPLNTKLLWQISKLKLRN